MKRKATLLMFLFVFLTANIFAQITKSIVIENKVIITPNENFLNIEPNVLEDFESYQDFVTEFTPWILNDVDGSATYGITDVDFPNSGTAMAYIIFNPHNTTPSMGGDAELAAHSGNKFAACFAAQSPPNNDWLITPLLTMGTNSSLNFWGKSFTTQYGAERLKILVSTSGTNPSDFTEISSGYIELPADWNEYYYDLSQFNNQNIHIAFQCVSNDAFILMLDDILVSTEEVPLGSTLTGTVTNALDGMPIEGALVEVAGLSDLTDAQGNYTIEGVPEGSLTANFTGTPTSGESPLTVQFSDLSTGNTQLVICSATDFITYNNSQVIIPPDGTVTLDISLSPVITGDEMRFIVNWGANPRDLDSHLRTPEIEGTSYHIYYSSQGSATSAPYAALDHDVTQGYGPETMTIYDFFTGIYHYYIYKFAGEGEITTSGAVVQVYNSNGLIQTLQAPTTGEGRYWYIGTIDGTTQSLTLINIIQDTEPGTGKRNVVYPAKPDSENNYRSEITTWNWNFGDGQTSSLQSPNHIYTSGGNYTVSLTVGDGTIENTETKVDYIHVEGSTGTATLSGMVTNALNGNPIEGALVEVAGLYDYTDAEGNYIIENVPEGTLTANFMGTPTSGDSPLTVQFSDLSTGNTQLVTCSANDFITYNNNQVSIPPDGTVTLNISLSPVIMGDEMRFVVNWGANPRDLDSHLRTPEIEGTSYHIYYSSQGSATSAPYAALDHDVTQGYGPETMTIYDFFTGTYHYYIYKFAGTGEITTSGAVVQVYNESGLIQTLQAPTTGEGRYWYIGTIDGITQTLTIINTIQDTEPGTGKKNVEYPAKPDSDNNQRSEITTWNWSFGDGLSSSVQNPSHIYQSGGDYTVSLIVGDGTSENTETKINYIHVEGPTGTATLSGMVTNALDGNPIEGALVEVAGLHDYTDAQGNYIIENVPEGILTANFMGTPTEGVSPLTVQFSDLSTGNTQLVTCSATDFITYYNNQVSIPLDGTVTLDISLSPVITGNEMRFIVNWGAEPRDLDSHLRTPEIDGTSYHIYYSSQGSATSSPYAALDHDVTHGFGPETMTIYDFFTGTYHYYIYKFAGTGEITTSGAVVQVYNESGLIQTLQAPTTGEGRYWYIGTINGTSHTLTIINTIQDTEPGTGKRNVVYPAKPDSDNNYRSDITTWNWNFGDGQTSTQQNPSHIYTSDGDYTVSLTVGDGSNTNLETKVDYIKVGPYSIEEIISESIDLYPNPAYGSVQFKSEYKIQQVKIYNYSGKLIKDIIVNDYSVIVNVENLESGIYMIQSNIETYTITKKLIIR